MVTPYQLYQHILTKGYVIPMEGQISTEEMSTAYKGTGEHIKGILEVDRRNVFKAYFGVTPPDEYIESTWLAGEPGHGMLMPVWSERLIHAEVLHMQEKIDTTIDYLLHHMSKGIDSI